MNRAYGDRDRDCRKNKRINGENVAEDYQRAMTKLWHEKHPATQPYEVCGMSQATHVIFGEEDLVLVEENSKGILANKIYTLYTDKTTCDYYIIDENNEKRIGFDLFIPCDFLRIVLKNSKTNNVVFIGDYRTKIKQTKKPLL